MDSFDRDAGAEVPAVEIEVFVVVVNSGGAAAAAIILLSRSVGVAGRSFSAPPALAGVHDDAQQLAISW